MVVSEFINLYLQYIESCNQITMLLIFILKISKSKLLTKISIAKSDIINKLGGSNRKVDKAKNSLNNSKIWLKLTKSKNKSKRKDHNSICRVEVFISKTKAVFTKLRQVFIKALILYFLDLKYYIQLKRDIFS